MLLWNYRGYGMTKANSIFKSFHNVPTPDNIKSDAESVLG